VPEGDTVWLHARRLDAALAGATLRRTDFRVPSLATANLAGWTVTDVASRGKHILLRAVAPDGRRFSLHSHLRMDGTWRLFRPGERWRGRPGQQVRVVLETPDTVAVGFQLHDLTLVPTREESRLVGHLGPDPLGADWDPGEAVRRLRAQPTREIATALLDQRNLAGIGNLYKCEVLFLSGISPWTPVADVADLAAVVDLAYRLLQANKERWVQVTTGSSHPAERTWVFERAGRPCRRCGTRIRYARGDRGRMHQGRIDRNRVGHVGMADRVTYWCPRCQPEPDQ
jgi:endonuclease-8